MVARARGHHCAIAVTTATTAAATTSAAAVTAAAVATITAAITAAIAAAIAPAPTGFDECIVAAPTTLVGRGCGGKGQDVLAELTCPMAIGRGVPGSGSGWGSGWGGVGVRVRARVS